MIQLKGGNDRKLLFHDQSLQKYGTRPGSNSRPISHLLPDMLLTAIFSCISIMEFYFIPLQT